MREARGPFPFHRRIALVQPRTKRLREAHRRAHSGSLGPRLLFLGSRAFRETSPFISIPSLSVPYSIVACN